MRRHSDRTYERLASERHHDPELGMGLILMLAAGTFGFLWGACLMGLLWWWVG